MNFFSILSLTVGVITITSCTKDVGPNPDLVPKETNPCDSITFTTQIKPIIDNQCVNCHSAGGQSPDLSTYSLLKAQVDGGRIKARVIDQNPSPMPPAGNLSSEELNSIKCWLDAGAPNN